MALQTRLARHRAAQRPLPNQFTERVHGKESMELVLAASAILFGDWDPQRAQAGAFNILAQEIPTVAVLRAGVALGDAVVASGLVKSKSEARRQLEQGGIYVNQKRETGDRPLADGDWLAGGNLLLRKGKK